MEKQNGYSNDYNSYKSPVFGTSQNSIPAPRSFSENQYKLYVRPIALHHDATSLIEMFSECGKVTEIYLSPISEENGFRWAFIYYDNQASAGEAICKFNNPAKYDFKVNYAICDPTKKKFPKPVPSNETMNYSTISDVGTKAETNGVSFVSPPNCKYCKKLTFFQCASCHKPFCNNECSLDGWRFHTGECIKVANLTHTDETKKPTANGPNLSDTVVSFMKNISISKKNFSSDEFAAAVKPGPVMPERPAPILPDYKTSTSTAPQYDHRSPPTPEYDQYKSNNSFQHMRPTPSRPEYNEHRSNDSFPNRKPFAKKYPDNDIIDSSRPAKNYQLKSDADEVNATQNGYHRDSLGSRINFKSKKSTDQSISFNGSKRESNDSRGRSPPSERSSTYRPSPPTETKPPKPNRPLTDLQIQAGESMEVVVTSVVDETTFFVADPQKCHDCMKIYSEEVGDLPILENVKVGVLCFGLFEGEWFRAQIISVDPLKVVYIDFGNEDVVERNNLKVMPGKYKKTLPLATKVQLNTGTVASHDLNEFDPTIIYPKKQNESGVWIVDIL